MLENLFLIDSPSLAKWNADKTVKEETGGAPFLLDSLESYEDEQ